MFEQTDQPRGPGFKRCLPRGCAQSSTSYRLIIKKKKENRGSSREEIIIVEVGCIFSRWPRFSRREASHSRSSSIMNSCRLDPRSRDRSRRSGGWRGRGLWFVNVPGACKEISRFTHSASRRKRYLSLGGLSRCNRGGEGGEILFRRVYEVGPWAVRGLRLPLPRSRRFV